MDTGTVQSGPRYDVKTGLPPAENGNQLTLSLRADQISVLLIGSGADLRSLYSTCLRLIPADRITLLPLDGYADIAENTAAAEVINAPYDAAVLENFQLIITSVTDEQFAEEVYTDAAERNLLLYSFGFPQFSTAIITFDQPEANPTPSAIAVKTKLNGNTQQEKRWKRIANWCLFALSFMFIGHAILSYLPFQPVLDQVKTLPQYVDERFAWMLLAGFLAQLVDGALGMGYGVISTTILLSAGLNPAAISGSIHTAEMFSSGASGYTHYRFGNVNKKLFKTLLIPGVLGAIAGAILLGTIGEKYALWFRPILSVYTLLLGVRILSNAFKSNIKPKKVKRVGWLAGAGGFLDSFGGGGWGPLVTSTLISKGRSPRYVIGSVSLTEFFVTLSSALTFFVILGISHWQAITGLIIGGVLAAPLAARFAGKLAVKKMFIGVGTIVIISSIRIIWNFLAKM